MITFSFAGQSIQTERRIGNVGNDRGPTVVFVAGMHGNEPTGVIAIRQVFDELAAAEIPMTGRMIGMVGNMAALQCNQRQIKKDLNRLWNQDFLKKWKAKSGNHADVSSNSNESSMVQLKDADESHEQMELWSLIDPLLKDSRYQRRKGTPPQLYFADLHTTSSRSIPFIAINDQLDNRRFALKFPVPTIFGIEEFLQGPLLTILNDEGHVAVAFEAGQHDDPESLRLHKSFIYCSLVNAGVIQVADLANDEHQHRLQQANGKSCGIFEVVYRKPVLPEDLFVMKPGFENFSELKKGMEVAHDKNGLIRAHRSGMIFMPLYQSIGSDGFFIVRRVPGWALGLSRFLRNINFESLLVLLPGVSRSQTQRDALVVNKKVAKFLAVELFHLLGYRRKQDDGDKMIVSRREIEKRD